MLCVWPSGQFERGEEPPYEGSFADICAEVCSGLAALGCLDDEHAVPLTFTLPPPSCTPPSEDEGQREHEGGGASASNKPGAWKSPVIPLVMLGFSLGTCFTAGLVQCLQRQRGVRVAQVVSIGGLTHQKMKVREDALINAGMEGVYQWLYILSPHLLFYDALHAVTEVSNGSLHASSPGGDFFGRAPEGLHQFLATADEDAIATIMRYFDEGNTCIGCSH